MFNFDRIVIAAALIIASQPLAGCQRDSGIHGKAHPAHVEHNKDGSNMITLTEKAMERIDLQTAIVRETQVSGGEGSQMQRKIVPYSALIYDNNGGTWVYVNREPRKFVREPVKVERIDGEEAYLFDGPDTDTPVASVGVAELYGVESGVGH